MCSCALFCVLCAPFSNVFNKGAQRVVLVERFGYPGSWRDAVHAAVQRTSGTYLERLGFCQQPTPGTRGKVWIFWVVVGPDTDRNTTSKKISG